MPSSMAARMTLRTDQVGVVGLQPDEAMGDLGRHPPGLAAVGARLGVEGLEAAIAVEPDPVPHGVGGDPGSGGAGDGVGLASLVAQLGGGARRAQRQMHRKRLACPILLRNPVSV